MRNTPAWGENFDTTRLCLMIVFNSTGYKNSLLFFLFKLWTISIHFPCLGWIITEFFTFAIKTFFSPIWHEYPPPSFLHFCIPCQSINYSLLLSHLFSTLISDLLSTNDLLILIFPVHCIFSRDAALVLVDVLRSLDVLLGLLVLGFYWLRCFLPCFNTICLWPFYFNPRTDRIN